MELSDLRIFVTATRHPSLHAAAGELNMTPSALSKAIRRLEDALRAPLFDRAGKTLQLNATGQRLRERAIALLHLAEQTKAEVEGAGFRVHCRVAAPALLQWKYGPALATALTSKYADSSLVLKPAFEDEALAALLRGEVDFAIVTEEPLRNADASGLEARRLGQIEMRLAAGRSHPLARKTRSGNVRCSSKRVLEYDFACPSRSPFCGVPRGMRSDGWRNDELPRRIRYWVDDLQVLLSIVQSGRALAYLPEFALRDAGLVRIEVGDCPFRCTESAWLVWRPAIAAGWQSAIVDLLDAD
ncbi:MAG TPA: LysR family transcriptional regulator [Paucimonas sp.]|nr:LysR family transcriptional regulator [Paucimonas sp.]